jgi:hypothetical protein
MWPTIWVAEILVGFVLWRLLLRNAYARIRWWPLASAYAAFTAVLFGASVVASALGSQQAGYGSFFYTLSFALPALTLIGLPLSAYFVRVSDLNYIVASILTTITVLAIMMALAIFPLGVESWTFVAVVLAVALFFVAMIVSIARRERRLVRPSDQL